MTSAPSDRRRILRSATAVGVVVAVVSVGVFTYDSLSLDALLAPDNGVQSWSSSAQRPPADKGADSKARAAIEKVLAARGQAVIGKDVAAWQSTLDFEGGGFAQAQEAVWRNLSAVTFSQWEYRWGGTTSFRKVADKRLLELKADEAWVVPTILEYQVAGPGGKQIAQQSPVRREQTFTVVRRGSRWMLASDSEGPTSVDLWDLGPVSVRFGKRCVVLSLPGSARVQRLVEETDRAAEAVDGVWGDAWPRVVMMVLPENQQQMARLLDDADDKGFDQIAAVTTGEMESSVAKAPTTGDRIVINPNGFEDLGSSGRGIVLRHELTHVATRGTGDGDVPKWLSEGFADYVGYLGTEVTPAVIAADAVKALGKDGFGQALPNEAAFNARERPVASAYSGSWAAVNILIKRFGQAKVVEFYRKAAAGRPANGTPTPSLTVPAGTTTTVTIAPTPSATPRFGPAVPQELLSANEFAADQALRDSFQLDVATLTKLWRAELQQQADREGVRP